MKEKSKPMNISVRGTEATVECKLSMSPWPVSTTFIATGESLLWGTTTDMKGLQ